MDIQKRLQVEFEFLGDEQISANTALKIINDIFKEAESEQLLIQSVSQQRELLFAYEKMRTKHITGDNDEWRYSNVDLFIENNCG